MLQCLSKAYSRRTDGIVETINTHYIHTCRDAFRLYLQRKMKKIHMVYHPTGLVYMESKPHSPQPNAYRSYPFFPEPN